jgi:hypothetical protein
MLFKNPAITTVLLTFIHGTPNAERKLQHLRFRPNMIRLVQTVMEDRENDIRFPAEARDFHFSITSISALRLSHPPM